VRVGISGLAVSNSGGLGRLARTSIIALASARPDWELYVYLRSHDDVTALRDECDTESLPLVDNLRVHFPSSTWRARLVLEELDLPRQLRPLKLDTYLGLDFTLPTKKMADVQAVMLPDLLPFTHPRTVSMRARLLYRRGIKRAIARGARMICISEKTREQLDAFVGVAPARPQLASEGSRDRAGRAGATPTTYVIHPAISPRLLQLADAALVRDRPLQVRGTHCSVTDPGRYLLYVGDNGPRKNVALLCSVYRSMVERGEYPGSLILAGCDGKHGTSHNGKRLVLETVGSAVGRDLVGRDSVPANDSRAGTPAPPCHIYDLGRVSDNDLSELYANADLLVNLSSEEGFGYPVLEAIAHGTPAVVTKGSAMQECAPAGIVPTPLEPQAIAETITSAVTALPLLRQEIHAIDRGWFNIGRMGQQLAEVLEK
jgi:glycosyltransferase involved in cell wall biosynthesis